MVSPILDIVELAEDQVDRYLTINAAITRLESATHGEHADASAGTAITLTDDEFFGHGVFRVSGGSANFDLTTKGNTPVGLQNTNKIFVVINDDTTYDCTVESNAAGDTVVVAQGETKILFQNHDDIEVLADLSPAAPVIPYDVSFFHAATPTSAQVLAEIEFARACTIADDFSGSQGYTGVNPNATFIIDIKKNGTDFGDVSFSTGGVPTFTTDVTTESFAAGDRLSFVAPGTADTTVGNIAITIATTVD